MKYCCENFKYRTQGTPNMGLNIRIIKISDKFIKEGERRGFPHKSSRFSFVLTEGYSGRLEFNNQYMLIYYCPFCGKKLEKYYARDEFINETNHAW